MTSVRTARLASRRPKTCALSDQRPAGVRRYMAAAPIDRAGGCQIGPAANSTATGTVIADALKESAGHPEG